MESAQDQILIFRIIEYGMKKKYFSINELIADLQLEGNDVSYLRNTLLEIRTVTANPNRIIVLASRVQHKTDNFDHLYTLLPNAIIQYVDYLEIVEARRNAKEAKQNANVSLTVAVYALLITVLLGVAQMFFEAVKTYYGR